MKYLVNWERTPQGNGIKSGDTLTINVPGTDYISGGIFQNNFPVLAFFEMGENVSLRLVKGKTWFGTAKPLPRGTYVLKTRTATNGWDDKFEVI